MNDLVAFGETLVGERALSPTELGYFSEHISRMASESPDQLAQYRTASQLLGQLAGQPFSSLSVIDRIDLLRRHRLDRRVMPRGDEPEPFAPEAQMVRARIIPDLIGAYWASPAGWMAVGYAIFPGRCGELTRYTRPES